MRIALASALAAVLIAADASATSCTQNSWLPLGGGIAGGSGTPVLAGTGSLSAGCPVQLTLSNALPNSAAILIVGFAQVSLPLFGGTLIPAPDFVLPPVATGAGGSVGLGTNWPASVPAGLDLYFQYWVADAAAPQGYSASNGLKATSATGPEPGTFPATWINGLPNCASEPQVQIHAYNQDLYILRQSVCTNFEAPFITLIFGDTKVLMLDTGAGGIQIYNTVKGVIDAWLLQKGKPSIQLIAAHLHGHGDHVAGDSQFSGKPNVTLVGTSQTAVKNFFGITTWPTQIVPYDLGGGRIVDVIPIPGHQSAHIAIYDRRTALLFTGDTLYPGRLYINGAVSQAQFPVYKASIQRLVDFTATKDLCWVIGTHIEMSTTPFDDYPIGASTHPNEHVLQLTRAHLLELNNAIIAMGNSPVLQPHADFIIYPIN